MDMLADFCHKYGDSASSELLDRICDAAWNHQKDQTVNGVDFEDIIRHNECNHTLTGRILWEDEVYGFVIDSGNWGGTEVRKFYKEDYGKQEFWQDIEDRKCRRQELHYKLFVEPKLRQEEQERKRKQAIFDAERAQRRQKWLAEQERKFSEEQKKQKGRWVSEGF